VQRDFDEGSAERLTSEVFSFLCRGCLRIPDEQPGLNERSRAPRERLAPEPKR
jgi:hypothetical protein